MKTYTITAQEFENILNLHKKWLAEEEGGERAVLHRADLREADLCEADLREADLSYADLCGADLCEADLREADLREADLREADLRGADLRGANLRGADLRGADLRGADLRGADLCGADLRGADLCGANLRNADLRGADLDYACLPLWCGSLCAEFDDKQLKQIAYHLVKAGLCSKNASGEAKAELCKLISFANGFHRVQECGLIEAIPNFDEGIFKGNTGIDVDEDY